MKETIRQITLSAGADICGFANIDRFADSPIGFSPSDIYKDCHSILVLGVALPKGLSQVNPQLIYHYFNGYAVTIVDDLLFRVAKLIENKYDGSMALPLPCDMSSSWDETTKTAHGLLSMKHLAVKAGVGFMGKNTILCNEHIGNLLTVGTILLNLDLPSDELCKNLCPPRCHKCIDNCPAHAIRKDGTVNQLLCREHTYKTTFRNYGTTECNLCRMGCPLRFGVKHHSNK